MTNDKPFDFAFAGRGWYVVSSDAHLPEFNEKEARYLRLLTLKEQLGIYTYSNVAVSLCSFNDLRARKPGAYIGWAYYE
jgi:hypothetical protein